MPIMAPTGSQANQKTRSEGGKCLYPGWKKGQNEIKILLQENNLLLYKVQPKKELASSWHDLYLEINLQ